MNLQVEEKKEEGIKKQEEKKSKRSKWQEGTLSINIIILKDLVANLTVMVSYFVESK